MAKSDNIDFTVIVLDGCLSSAVAVTLDMLGTANQCIQALGVRRQLRWVVRSPRATVDLGAGMHLSTQPLNRRSRLGDWLKQLSPACQVDTSRMVVEDRGVTTAGAAMGQVDLMLHLLGHRAGSKVVDLVLKSLLLDRRPSQAVYALWHRLAVQSPLTARLEDLVMSSLPNVPTVEALSRQLCMSSRTLARHIVKDTGLTPLQFIQGVRMRQAQLLLETSALPVSEVASRVGYADPSGLHRLTRHLAKQAPGRLKPRT